MHDAATNIHDDDDTPEKKGKNARVRARIHDVEGEKPNGRCCRPPPPLYPGGAHCLALAPSAL